MKERKKRHENKRLCFGVEPGHSTPQMGFETPIEEPQREVAFASTPRWGEKKRVKEV